MLRCFFCSVSEIHELWSWKSFFLQFSIELIIFITFISRINNRPQYNDVVLVLLEKNFSCAICSSICYPNYFGSLFGSVWLSSSNVDFRRSFSVAFSHNSSTILHLQVRFENQYSQIYSINHSDFFHDTDLQQKTAGT